jgi:hypothetical protein
MTNPCSTGDVGKEHSFALQIGSVRECSEELPACISRLSAPPRGSVPAAESRSLPSPRRNTYRGDWQTFRRWHCAPQLTIRELEAGSIEIRDAFPDHRRSCAISRRLPRWQPAAGVRRVAVAARLFRKREGPARDISLRAQTRSRPIPRLLAARHERSLADKRHDRAQDGGSR